METLDYATPVRGILKSTGTGEYSTYMFPHIHGYNLKKIYFANENTGYIVGSKNNGSSIKGSIWKNSTGINAPGEGLGTTDETLKSIKIYPNPASNKINISISDQFSESTIILTDISGKLV